MRCWNQRSKEVAYLLNPAFCGRLIYQFIICYEKECEAEVPIALAYLVLPLVLPAKTRTKISSRTQLAVWVKSHPEVLVNYAKRARSLIGIANEAIEYLLQADVILLTSEGRLSSNARICIGTTGFSNNLEIKECIKKSEHVARWFARAGKPETVYAILGVRP